MSSLKKLYSKKERSQVGFEGIEWAPITTESSVWLERPFEEVEIRAAIEECDGDKAPGPDGYTMEVFRKCWDVIKNDVMGVFNEFFAKGIVNACTNST